MINNNVVGRGGCAYFQLAADFCPQRVRNSQTTGPSKNVPIRQTFTAVLIHCAMKI